MIRPVGSFRHRRQDYVEKPNKDPQNGTHDNKEPSPIDPGRLNSLRPLLQIFN